MNWIQRLIDKAERGESIKYELATNPISPKLRRRLIGIVEKRNRKVIKELKVEAAIIKGLDIVKERSKVALVNEAVVGRVEVQTQDNVS